MKTTDFKEGGKYTFVIPTGSTEQHGPFLPLGTDSFIQDRIIEGIEKRLPDIIFLPTMDITCSQEHEGFAGSVWISYTTMELVIREICQSLHPYAKRIILMTAHGGNVEILRDFAKTHQNAFDGVELLYVEMNSEEVDMKTREIIGGPIDDHAGNTEISMMLAIDETISLVPQNDYPKKSIQEPFKTNHIKDVSEDGIADNHPQWIVDKNLGEKIINWIVEELSQRIRSMI